MGIGKTGLNVLLGCKRAGIVFGNAITLGRQGWHLFRESDLEDIDLLLRSHDAPLPEQFVDRIQFLQFLAEWLGFTSIDALDVSDYEGANLAHDLNDPIPKLLTSRYDLVFDGGTLEHVFNLPTAITNVMKMLRVGGYFISTTTANNFLGHGFYQFSPELFYRAFSLENGFAETQVFLSYETGRPNLHRLDDPDRIGARQEIKTRSDQATLVIISRKVVECEPFKRWPQQSDYSSTWSKKLVTEGGSAAASSIEITGIAEQLRLI